MFIIISGKARRGKDTFAVILKEELESDSEVYFPLLAFAGIIKDKLKEDFKLSNEQLYGRLKEVPDTRYPKLQFNEIDSLTQNTSTITYWTPRELMQNYGEFFRHIKPTFWVDRLLSYCKDNNIDNVIITDARFPNEIDTVKKEHKVVHIRITRSKADIITNSHHNSEIALDNYTDVDYIVENEGTIEDLRTWAKKIKEEITLDGR